MPEQLTAMFVMCRTLVRVKLPCVSIVWYHKFEIIIGVRERERESKYLLVYEYLRPDFAIRQG